MSSGTRYDPGSVRALISGVVEKLTVGTDKLPSLAEAMQRISRLGMSPRQQALNRLWAWYRCEQYSARRVDWNGREASDPIEHEAIASAGFIPPGFYDAGESYPIKFRRPTAPYALCKVIVDRFTGLLFSERHHPKVQVAGDDLTEDFLQAIAESGRLWSLMIQARTFGGAMGTVALGFQFVAGQIEFEAHDPRWCTPVFADRAKLKLAAIEKRYMYPEDEVDPTTGRYVTVWYWYRRIINDENDILFAKTPVGDGNEPEWIPEKVVSHGLGFCPVVWIQNLPVQDDIDGDPDCLGVYEMVETIDALIAQGNKGTLANCDPTLVLVTKGKLNEVKKGSDNAIKLPEGSNATYLEITGQGPKSALELAMELRRLTLEVAQCVLEHPDVQNRTATEIERVYSSMIAKADVLREQYGEKGIKPLLEMVLAAAGSILAPAITEEGEEVVGEITLPPRETTNEEGEIVAAPRVPGAGGAIELSWPTYFGAPLTDVELATRAAIAAKTGGLIDKRHAVRFVSEYFKVEDVQEMLARILEEAAEEQAAAEAQALGMLHGGTPGIPGEGGESP